MNPHCTVFPVLRGFEEVADLYHLLNRGSVRGFIAGSYAAWMVASPERWTPNDVDVFATSKAAFQDELPLLLMAQDYFCRSSGNIVKEFQHRQTLQNLQLVAPHDKWSNFPDDIIDSFDLTAGMAVLANDGYAIAHPHAGGCESKILRINEPIRTLKRVMKYAQRGVTFESFELVKLFAAWDEMTEEQKIQAVDLHVEPPPGGDDENRPYFEYDSYFFEE